jgi:hypothetical protein
MSDDSLTSFSYSDCLIRIVFVSIFKRYNSASSKDSVSASPKFLYD